DSASAKEADGETDAEAFHQQSDDTMYEKESESNDESTDPEPEPVLTTKAPSIRVQKNHPKDLIIGNPNQG
ncbi:hypothetical protein A2U01_0109035, partial [Trifolium medium]|nr:hypothetical protein [Trifolium medium]